jgi:hypothetical protein
VPCKATIHNIVTKLPSVGSALEKYKSRKVHELTAEKLDDTGTRLGAKPVKAVTSSDS